jgi:hypothetical protein
VKGESEGCRVNMMKVLYIHVHVYENRAMKPIKIIF